MHQGRELKPKAETRDQPSQGGILFLRPGRLHIPKCSENSETAPALVS